LNNTLKTVFACVAVAAICDTAEAVIPGFGQLYGKNSFYLYNEYNCNPRNGRDQFFLSYFEYGLADWAALEMQTINYPDGSYHDLSLGGALQIWNAEWLALRGYALYDFGNGAPNAKADSMCYGLTGSGMIWRGLGYIYQVQCGHPCHGDPTKPTWLQQAYVTYNVTDRLTPYVSLTTDLCNVDTTTDVSVGGWYTLIRNQWGFRWISLYFDVANLTEKHDDIRISAGLDMLF